MLASVFVTTISEVASGVFAMEAAALAPNPR